MNPVAVIEQTFFANARFWGGLNGSLRQNGHLYTIKTGIASGDLNMVWCEKPLSREDEDAIRLVKKDFQENALPFWFWIFPSAKSAPTLHLLRENGFSQVASAPCMLVDLIRQVDRRETKDSLFTMRQVRNSTDLALWEAISFAGFEFPPETARQYSRFTRTFHLSGPSPQKYFLGLYDGKPVATAMLFLTGDAAGVYFIATLADYRKRGIGLNLTLAMLREANSAGARYVSLQSSPDGLRVYQQAGFKEYCRVDAYSLQD